MNRSSCCHTFINQHYCHHALYHGAWYTRDGYVHPPTAVLPMERQACPPCAPCRCGVLSTLSLAPSLKGFAHGGRTLCERVVLAMRDEQRWDAELHLLQRCTVVAERCL